MSWCVPCQLTEVIGYSDDWPKTATSVFIPMMEVLTMFNGQSLSKLMETHYRFSVFVLFIQSLTICGKLRLVSFKSNNELNLLLGIENYAKRTLPCKGLLYGRRG